MSNVKKFFNVGKSANAMYNIFEKINQNFVWFTFDWGYFC